MSYIYSKALDQVFQTLKTSYFNSSNLFGLIFEANFIFEYFYNSYMFIGHVQREVHEYVVQATPELHWTQTLLQTIFNLTYE